MIINQFNPSFIYDCKKFGIYGDVILAKRLEPGNVTHPSERLSSEDISRIFWWEKTPQGYYFWKDIQYLSRLKEKANNITTYDNIKEYISYIET